MLTLAWPWPWLLLPLPWLLHRILPPACGTLSQPLPMPTLPLLSTTLPRQFLPPGLLAALAWILLLTALSRPQWLGEPLALALPQREILLAVDLSDSMRTRDMLENGSKVDRLAVVRQRLKAFVARRAGDRMGLILFADHAYRMMPVSDDWQTLDSFLDELDFGLAGHLTAIGEAIALALQGLDSGEQHQPVLILLSDGRDTVDESAPLAMARLAAQRGLKIYTIGLGARPRPGDGPDLDEPTLEAVAGLTGGRYFRARDPATLSGIYAEIDRLEPVARTQRYFRPREELYVWPLALALLALLTLLGRVGHE